MNVFEAVKQSVTTRQAAEHYGIRVGRNGMACCPFHNDKTPSMKLDRRYHCFGCGADGDVIDFNVFWGAYCGINYLSDYLLKLCWVKPNLNKCVLHSL